jgi:4,5-DOPA dioxygenase extradiol
MDIDVMPAAFIGHGSPANAFETNRYTAAWRQFGQSIPRPRAVLAISAHWFIHATAVTAMAKPRTIHDFFGFPPEYFAFEYPAPGDPGLAAEVSRLADPTWVGLDQDSWGLDHGTWSVLHHLFPAADVPVVQLSINAAQPASYHLALGTSLAPLRHQGILVLASGNIVHNLGLLDPSRAERGFAWAERFDEAARAILTDGSAEEFVDLEHHPDYQRCVPTPDHYFPALYLAGLAAAADERASVLVDGYALGSLSMTSYTLGA